VNNIIFTILRDLQIKTYQALNTSPPHAPKSPISLDE
jgi:hypothetical protein